MARHLGAEPVPLDRRRAVTGDWRARKRAATKRAIQDEALRLFAERGYDTTTVEDIAAAAGVSHMTFFRYFSRKESVVEYDDYDPILAELIAGRPPQEPPLTAVHAAIREGALTVLVTDRDAILARTRLILDTPALRSRNWIAQDTTRELIAGALARRAGLAAPDYAMTVQASVAVGAMLPAIEAWAADPEADLVALVDAAFAALGA